MRIARGHVSNGRIIVEGEPLADGAEVAVILADESSFELSADDEAGLLLAVAEADRGETLDAATLLSQFRR